MATWHHLNGQLFMPVTDLRKSVIHDSELTVEDEQRAQRMGNVRDFDTGERRPAEIEDAFWERKGDEADRSGVSRSVRSRGIVHPINLQRLENSRNMVTNGYHRIAMFTESERGRLLPVTFTPTPEADDDLPVHYDRLGETRLYPQDDE